MPFSARFRRGTTPSSWRSYHGAQLNLAASCMTRSSVEPMREPSIRELVHEFEKSKTAPAERYVNIGRR
jgi:hypothetical protein